MAGLTQAQAQAQLDAYMDAETAALNNQSYSIGGRTLTRANLKDIREGIQYWNAMVKELAAENNTGSQFGFYRGVVG